MKSLHEILVGHVKPGTQYVGVAPLGKNGLSRRMQRILYFQAMAKHLGSRQAFRFANTNHNEPFAVITAGLNHQWVSEILRILDRPRSRGRENLTVELLHERFAASPEISQEDREEEARLFKEVKHCYESGQYREFRNRVEAHIDLQDALADVRYTGSLHTITDVLFAWFRHVATVAYKGEPTYFTTHTIIRGKSHAKLIKRLFLDASRCRQPGKRKAPP